MRFGDHQVCDSELFKLRKELKQAQLDRAETIERCAKQLEIQRKDHTKVVTLLTDKLVELVGIPANAIKDKRQENKDDGLVSLEEAPPEQVRDLFLNQS